MRYFLPFYFFLFILLGCGGVSRYSANTTAKYKVCDPTGVCTEFYYESEKEQKIAAKFIRGADGRIEMVEFSVESGTSEAALAASVTSTSKLTDILEKWAPIIAKGAMAGS
jgi:hypothetical protein